MPKNKSLVIVESDLESLMNFRFELLIELKSKFLSLTCIVPFSKHNSHLIDVLQSKDIKVIQIRIDRGSRKIANVVHEIIHGVLILNSLNPDALLLISTRSIFVFSIARLLAFKKPITYSYYTGLGFLFIKENINFKTKIVAFVLKILSRTSSGVIFQNKDDFIEIINKPENCSRQKSLIVNGSGVDLNYYNPSYRVNQTNGRITFIMIGRLLIDKGVYEFIEAAKEINAKYNYVSFVLVGGGDENPRSLTALEIGKLRNSDFIRYIGKTNDVRSYLARSDVFVLPSYREGTPKATLEAMAMGLPIITTDAPGCRETVSHSRNGLIIQPRSTVSLINAIVEVLNNQDKLLEYGQESRRMAESKYDVKLISTQIAEFINTTSMNLTYTKN